VSVVVVGIGKKKKSVSFFHYVIGERASSSLGRKKKNKKNKKNKKEN
jgi:hypothetical protein